MVMTKIELIYPYPKPTVTPGGRNLAKDYPDHNAYDEYRMRYEFYLYEGNLAVDTYAIEGKNKRQRNWRIIEVYERLHSRDTFPAVKVTEEQMPLYPNVIEDAKKALMAQMRVCKWSERNDNL